jgi:hypothetical protein
MEEVVRFTQKWLAHIILVIVIFVVLIVIIQTQQRELRTDGTQKSTDGNGSLYYYGRGSDGDSVDMLLLRTYWSAYLQKRLERWQRVFLITLFILIILMTIVWKRCPSVPKILVTSSIVFFVIYMLENFMYIHGDIYNDANIRNNTKLLANKLNLDVDFNRKPPAPLSDAPDRVTIM